MASLAALQAERDRLIEQISLVTAALESRRRALSRAESTLATTTNPAQRARLEAQIEEFSRDVAAFAGELAALNRRLAEIDNQIRNLQRNQEEGGGPAGPKVSAAVVAREDQAARA